MKAAILAGGRGTRLEERTRGQPKVMVPIAGKPLLQRHIELLRNSGITEIVLLVGYRAEVIRNFFRDGSSLGVSITYSEETEPLGTAGAVKKAASFLQSPFILLYGDVMIDMDLGRMVEFHREKGGIATLAVHPNSHPADSDLLETDDFDRITGFFPKPRAGERDYRNLVNAAVYVLSPDIFACLPGGFSDFGKNIFPELLRDGRPMYGYLTSEYIKDAGTPLRLDAVERDILSGKTSARNMARKQLAIFLDRDGVVNEEVDLACSADDIRLLPGAARAIRKINDSPFLGIVVTNQPAVARGLCDIREVHNMHHRIDTLLGAEGAFIDSYYFCPHHPDKGFEGENPAYKIVCTCRKPATGMVTAAVKKFNIDLKQSYIIGDTTRDIQTGKNAGLRTILVHSGYGGSDKKFAAVPDHTAAGLLEAVDLVLHRAAAGRPNGKAAGA